MAIAAQSTETPIQPRAVELSARVRSHAHAVTGQLPWIENAGKVASKDARVLSKLFFDRLRVLEEGTPAHQYARNTLIEMNRSLVRFGASRFRNRGFGEAEDIVQVGTIGLIKAIDRFDLSREIEFTSFALPYIAGEIKRYFRDTTWAVHVPRRLQERRVELARAKERLAMGLGREATVAELAADLGLSEKQVVEGIVAANGYTASSLDVPAESGDDGYANNNGRTHADSLGHRDAAMDLIENLHALAPLLGRLDHRERLIIDMRFGREMTQSQIGAELGVSQMQVSRLLSRTLARLRTDMLTDR